jgi:hypothetical protein
MDAVFFVTFLVYAVALVVVLSASLFYIVFRDDGLLTKTRTKQFVCLMTVLSLGLRSVWIFAHGNPSYFDSHALLLATFNRFSMLLFFTGFSSVVVQWGLTIRKIQLMDTKRYTVGAVTLCGLLWLVQLLFMVCSLAGIIDVNENRSSASFYKADNVALALCFLFPALAFISYLKQFERVMLQQGKGKTEAVRVTRAFSLLVGACFILRFVVYLYGAVIWTQALEDANPWLGGLDNVLYPTFFYTVPEVLPALATVVLASAAPDHKARNDLEASLTSAGSWADSIAAQRHYQASSEQLFAG